MTDEGELENKLHTGTLYIANQREGPFDEVQRFIMAYENGKPILMAGDPGSGKTQLAKFMGEVLGKTVHRINCEPDKEIVDLLGHEILVAEGSGEHKATATGFKKGDMVAGMENGEVVYLDEFNKLKHGVQKGLNSILEEESTYKMNGQDKKANNETCYVMAYNPGSGTDYEDIEPAVFDRTKYLRFEEQPKDFQIRVAMVKAGLLKVKDIIDEDMEERAIEVIQKDGKKQFRFLVKGNDGAWYEYGVAKKIEPEGNLSTYFYYKGGGDKKLTTKNSRANRYYKIISQLVEFVHDIKEVLRNGSNSLPEDFVRALNVSKFNNLDGCMPSFRMVLNSVQEYIRYTEQHEVEDELAKEQIAYDVINTVCAKITKDQKVGRNMTPKDLFKFIAVARGLLKKGDFPDIPDLPSSY